MAATFNESVSSEIRAEMGRQRMNQAELARRLGWAPYGLSRRLTGAVALSTDEIERIAETLRVPVDQLVAPARTPA